VASISNDKNGKRRILFLDPHGKRKTLWLGRISKRTAETIKVRVEMLVAALISGAPIDDETARWLSTIGDDLAEKLRKTGLMAPRESATLADFCESYITGRTDAAPNTIRNSRIPNDHILGRPRLTVDHRR
jgi:hypothetical protein